MKTKPFPIVKFSKPEPGEADFRFYQISEPDALGCVLLELIDASFSIAPVERVHQSEVTLCAS